MAKPHSPSRRRLLSGLGAAGAGIWLHQGMAGIVQAQQAPAIVLPRPLAMQGLQSGDMNVDRAMIWSRADRPARMIVESAATEQFTNARRVVGPHALEVTDFTARLDLLDLPADQEIFVRVTFESLDAHPTSSEPLVGRLRTAPRRRRDIHFLWSGDTAGQGYGINPDWGGMKTYQTMRQLRPDFFIHSGDTIYADGVIVAEKALSDGTVWKNVTTEAKSKVAQTLTDFRGNFLYNLLDKNVRAFNAEVPQVWQWDDHEVVDNWSDSKDLSSDGRYSDKGVRLLSARAGRAFREYSPMRWHGADDSERVYRQIPYGPDLDLFVIDMRSYRAGNSYNRQTQAGADTAFLGPTQVDWLKRGLQTSRATWKVIAADMPLGVSVGDGKDAQGRRQFEAVANGDGPACGRELELADLLRFIKRQRIENLVWLTADLHYTAAHHYHPDRAQFTDFTPFWEFVSGPLHAGTGSPGALDNTFGPKVMFQKGSDRPGMAPPSAGLQFFGQVQIEGRSREMVVTLRDVAGSALHSQRLRPVLR